MAVSRSSAAGFLQPDEGWRTEDGTLSLDLLL